MHELGYPHSAPIDDTLSHHRRFFNNRNDCKLRFCHGTLCLHMWLDDNYCVAKSMTEKEQKGYHFTNSYLPASTVWCTAYAGSEMISAVVFSPRGNDEFSRRAK